MLRKDDGFVGGHVVALGGLRFQHFIGGLFLQPGDEVYVLPVEFGKPRVVAIAAVENQHAAGGQIQLAGHCNIGFVALGDNGVVRQQALMIEQQMQLHGSLGLAIFGPVEDLGAEIDDGAVQTKQPAGQRQTRGALGLRELRGETGAEQLKQGLVDLPGTLLIGVGQCGVRRRLLHVEVAKLAFGGPQAFLDFAQTLGLAELAEEHGNELIPRAESTRMPLAAMLGNGARKQRRGDELQHLAENAGYSIHGAPSGRGVSSLRELILTLAGGRHLVSVVLGETEVSDPPRSRPPPSHHPVSGHPTPESRQDGNGSSTPDPYCGNPPAIPAPSPQPADFSKTPQTQSPKPPPAHPEPRTRNPESVSLALVLTINQNPQPGPPRLLSADLPP
ncbi:MAG: hypothetical protein U5J83_14170 [Bryobacterales bacterium]|nr:hypothetical protein [Bryobacterales bacterium]